MLTNKLRASLPEEIRKAERLTQDGNQVVEDAEAKAAQILEDAKAQSDKIIKDAQNKVNLLTTESEITRLAKLQCREQIERAEARSLEIAKGADEYAEQVLTDLQEYISRILSTIEKGRSHLKRKTKDESTRS